jgi:glutathione S-transferase
MRHWSVAEPLILHVEASWSSPWVCSVYFALRDKQLPFTTSIAMTRYGTGLIGEMRSRTLTGSAPVLQHGAFWLAESLPIIEYLEEMFPAPSVFPADPRDRARTRQLMMWLRIEHAALHRERATERIFYPGGAALPAMSPDAQRSADDLVRVIGKLCGARPAGPVFGDSFGVVDVELAFALMRLVATHEPVPDELAAYAAAVWAHPWLREFAEHRRPPNPPW